MIIKYKLFESKHYYNENLYYKDSVNEIIDETWFDIRIFRTEIKFKTSKKEYTVFFEGNGLLNNILLEDPKTFCDKLNKEFKKSPEEYIQNIKKDIYCLKDVTAYKNARNFNI